MKRHQSKTGIQAWDATVARLPEYLDQLLTSEVYGRGPNRVPPPRTHGVYLFTENGEHLYVGRCGLTERARVAGKGHSNFRARLAGHTRPSSGHNQATFAWRLAIDALGRRGMSGLPPTRAARAVNKRFKSEYLRQKERVTAMDFRVVEIVDDFDSYVFEPYAALLLETPYNSWATS